MPLRLLLEDTITTGGTVRAGHIYNDVAAQPELADAPTLELLPTMVPVVERFLEQQRASGAGAPSTLSTMLLLEGLIPGAGVILTNSAPVDVEKNTAIAGAAGEAARADHRHDVAVANPTGLIVGGGNVEGLSTALSRADHAHAITASDPVAVGSSNQQGVSVAFSRADHQHAITASPPTITGSRAGNAALASLLTELATLGLIVDGTTA